MQDALTPDLLPLNVKALHSTKTYGHERGLSCAFRQWRAHSHCRLVHGYAIAVKFTFAAQQVDECGWVVDFGGLQSLNTVLADTFDHKLLVAEDDPHLPLFIEMNEKAVAEIIVVPATGCEAFARMVFATTEQWLKDAGFSPRAWLVSVEISEHGANSAVCFG